MPTRSAGQTLPPEGVVGDPRISPAASPVVPTDAWAWSDERLAAHLHPLYRGAIDSRVPLVMLIITPLRRPGTSPRCGAYS